MDNLLLPGYSLKFDINDDYEHYVGGKSISYSPICPNCKKPLMLHMQIDRKDPRFSQWDFPFRFISLFYCMRCPLSWYPFQYRIKDNGEFDIQASNNEPDLEVEKEWEEEMKLEEDAFPMRSIDFTEIPTSIQELFKRLNSSEEISKDEEYKIAEFTDNFAPEEVGGYPVVDVINQVGGITFLPQQVDNPICELCLSNGNEMEMIFFASMTNDEKNNFKISYDSVQILFYMCPECKSIHVQNCM